VAISQVPIVAKGRESANDETPPERQKIKKKAQTKKGNKYSSR
jgi:hypothetical protein